MTDVEGMFESRKKIIFAALQRIKQQQVEAM